MDSYKISKDSPVHRVSVDTRYLAQGEGYVELTDSQAKRVLACDVKLDKKSSPTTTPKGD